METQHLMADKVKDSYREPVSLFNEKETLAQLKKYLPAQAPLKDFIFQNPLESFQDMHFHTAMHQASVIFGYKGYLALGDFRKLYKNNKIREDILLKVLSDKKGAEHAEEWKNILLTKKFDSSASPRIGQLRSSWKREYKIDLDSLVQPTLFRVACSYLDQGISIWNFPVWQKGFLGSVRELEKNSFSSFFRTPRARKLFLEGKCEIKDLLKIITGDEALYFQYLFDQQFSHQGWSGMVSLIEDKPHTLVDTRNITLKEFITLELLLEIDALDMQLGKGWKPLNCCLDLSSTDLFSVVEPTILSETLALWQEAYEWTYYDQALAALKMKKSSPSKATKKTFQAMFCIDDRETSFRDYLEKTDANCETFGTPGFFNVEFYFQPSAGKSYTKLCPAPVSPSYLIKEEIAGQRRKKEVFFGKLTHSILGGWLISQTLGFWSAFKLGLSIVRPSISPAASSSFRHMHPLSKLTIENTDPGLKENGWQVGFNLQEMAQRVEGLLRSIGLIAGFAPIVYVIGHGASSVNNPFYASMDCGACSCRPGSVNARAFSFMANHPKVRAILKERGITIPEETQFVGGLHDTTRDEVFFYDENLLIQENNFQHLKNAETFKKALSFNAKERARRFASVDLSDTTENILEKVRRRSVSLFEPRPELDHATNALTIIGRRELTNKVFLDRRAFLNSHDYKTDPEGQYLFNILKAAAPVCGGINMAYYLSRTDNQKLGAGTKLPHNVMGLFGVANGIEGDLRPGLPSQMVESHDPVRQLFIVEHYPEVVLQTIQKNAATYQWFINGWINLVVMEPETREYFLFRDGAFEKYTPITDKVETVSDITPIIESSRENIPVYLIS